VAFEASAAAVLANTPLPSLSQSPTPPTPPTTRVHPTRPVSADDGSSSEDVRLWVRAARLATLPRLWRGDVDACALGEGLYINDAAATIWRDQMLEAALLVVRDGHDIMCRAKPSPEATNAALRLAGAALLSGAGGRAREYGQNARKPAAAGPRKAAAAAGCKGTIQEALRGTGNYVLADALAGHVHFGGRAPGGPFGGGSPDAAAAGAAWALLRAWVTDAVMDPEEGDPQQATGVRDDTLVTAVLYPLLRLHPNALCPQPLVRAALCFSTQLAAAQARLQDAVFTARPQLGRVLVEELAEAVLEPPTRDSPFGSDHGRNPHRMLGHAAWRALAVAVLNACGGGNQRRREMQLIRHLCRPDRLMLAANIAVITVVTEVDLLGSSSSSSNASSDGSGSEALESAETALAAVHTLLLLAHTERARSNSSSSTSGDGSSGGGSAGATTITSPSPCSGSSNEEGPSWREALSDPRLRPALEALVLLPHPSTPAARSDDVAAGLAGLVTGELRCAATAALSLCYGQLGVRPQAASELSKPAAAAGSAADGGGGGGGLRQARSGDRPAVARDAERPDVEIASVSGWRLKAHGVVLSAASPVMRQRLQAAAAGGGAGEGAGGGGGGDGVAFSVERPLQIRLSDSVTHAALQSVVEFAYSSCTQLPDSMELDPAQKQPQQQQQDGTRQQLTVLARGLRMSTLTALCSSQLPLPGDRLPQLVASYAQAALPRDGIAIGLSSPPAQLEAPPAAAAAAAVGGTTATHEPAGSLLLLTHQLAQQIPRVVSTAAAVSGGTSSSNSSASALDGDPFADVWLAAPILTGTSDGPRPAPHQALLLPAHRLLLAARCPYLAAATSTRWDADAGGGESSADVHTSSSGQAEEKGSGGTGHRRLPTLVLPDADADVAWALLRWLYGAADALAFERPPVLLGSSSSSGSGSGEQQATGCAACRAARAAVRLRQCADILLLPALSEAVEGELAARLLVPLPAACLAALLRDAADLGQPAVAEVVFERLVELVLRNGE